MSLVINLTPSEEERLSAAATQNGLAREAFAEKLVREHMPSPVEEPDEAPGWPVGFFEQTYGSLANDPLHIGRQPMTHTIILSQEEEAAVEAAARAVGRSTSDFLHGLISQNLLPHGHALSPQRDQAAIRRRMVDQWKDIDADEDRATVNPGTDLREEAAA